MRQYLAMQAIESGKGLAGGFLGRSGLLPCGNGMLMGGDPTGQSKVRKLILREAGSRPRDLVREPS